MLVTEEENDWIIYHTKYRSLTPTSSYLKLFTKLENVTTKTNFHPQALSGGWGMPCGQATE